MARLRMAPGRSEGLFEAICGFIGNWYYSLDLAADAVFAS
jgi:hypothetical protein